MADEQQRPPDSLSGKLRELTEPREDDDAASGEPSLRRDAGADDALHSDDRTAVPPRRPTDPPF